MEVVKLRTWYRIPMNFPIARAHISTANFVVVRHVHERIVAILFVGRGERGRGEVMRRILSVDTGATNTSTIDYADIVEQCLALLGELT